MTGPYTLGDWYTKDGKEEQFIRRWEAFAAWTAATMPGAAFGKLLQDRSDPRRFVSFGSWSGDAAVAAWRAHPEFQERVAGLQELLESFVSGSFDVAAEVGPPTPDPW